MFSNLPPVTKALLIANGLVFLLQLMLGDAALAQFMLWPPMGSDDPYAYAFLPWQVLTYGFMHGGWAHLLFNMLALAMFGAPLEHVWGAAPLSSRTTSCAWSAPRCASLPSAHGRCSRAARPIPRWAHPAASSACCWRTACCSRTSA